MRNDCKSEVLVKFEGIDPADFHRAEQIVRDALGEFIDRRTPSAEYVEQRYAEQSPAFRKSKVVEVAHRTRVARTALIDLQMTEEPCRD